MGSFNQIKSAHRGNNGSYLPYLIFAAVTGILAFPVLKNVGNWGIRDWDLFTTLQAAAVRSIVEYHQFPFWNPYIGGGNILFAHPEVSVLNPLFALLLIFGPLTGLKLQILAVYFIGFIGTYKMARQLGISRQAAYLPPIVFMLSSYVVLHVAAGHIPFHFFSTLPWLIFFYKKSLARPVHILSAGGVVAFMILGSGAAVPLLFSLFFLFLFSLFDMGGTRKFWPPFFVLATGLSGMLFSAVKFFPMVDYLLRNPWIPEGTVQTTPISALSDMFFSFNQSVYAGHVQGYVWDWHEYGAFVGPVVAVLALTAIVGNFRKAWPFLVMIVISLLLVLGSFWPPFSPLDVLHHLPGFESIRVPSRFSILAVLCLAVLSGQGADYLLSIVKSRRWILSFSLFAAILSLNLYVCLPILGEAFTRSPENPPRHGDFRQTVGDPNRMYAAFLANEGTIRAGWVSAYRPGRGIMSAGDRVEEWYSPDNAVRIISREFSPNRLIFELAGEQVGSLVISQGYDIGWRAVDGREITPVSELISLQVKPDEQHLELYYYPRFFWLGLWVSLLSVGLAAISGLFLIRRLRL